MNSTIIRIIMWIIPMGIVLHYARKRDRLYLSGRFVSKDGQTIYQSTSAHKCGKTGFWIMYNEEDDIKRDILRLEEMLESSRKRLEYIQEMKAK